MVTSGRCHKKSIMKDILTQYANTKFFENIAKLPFIHYHFKPPQISLQ